MARAASELSPTVRSTSPQRVRSSMKPMAGARSNPTTKSALICSAERTSGELDQKPRSMAGSFGALGWMNGLPRKKARPVPNEMSAMPIATSLTRGRLHRQPCRPPGAAADAPHDPPHDHAEPRRAAVKRDRVRAHRAHDERALEPQVHAPALLGQALAEAHEQK